MVDGRGGLGDERGGRRDGDGRQQRQRPQRRHRAQRPDHHWLHVRRRHRLPLAAPATEPAAGPPERIIQVADNDLPRPGERATYTVEIRYRTKEKFGNIIQKGQSATKGGQFKIQNPQGRPSCLFKGSVGRVATRSTVTLNDNAWHILTCVRGADPGDAAHRRSREQPPERSTGAINNAIPFTIGGKINCDQIEITCDYFSGEIDYVRIDPRYGLTLNTPRDVPRQRTAQMPGTSPCGQKDFGYPAERRWDNASHAVANGGA